MNRQLWHVINEGGATALPQIMLTLM